MIEHQSRLTKAKQVALYMKVPDSLISVCIEKRLINTDMLHLLHMLPPGVQLQFSASL